MPKWLRAQFSRHQVGALAWLRAGALRYSVVTDVCSSRAGACCALLSRRALLSCWFGLSRRALLLALLLVVPLSLLPRPHHCCPRPLIVGLSLLLPSLIATLILLLAASLTPLPLPCLSLVLLLLDGCRLTA